MGFLSNAYDQGDIIISQEIYDMSFITVAVWHPTRHGGKLLVVPEHVCHNIYKVGVAGRYDFHFTSSGQFLKAEGPPTPRKNKAIFV